MALGPRVPGETPIDDISGLKITGIRTRAQLNEFEARNISEAILKYSRPRLSRRAAPFNVSWCLCLHREMLGNVWAWAGNARTVDLNFGSPFPMIHEHLQMLMGDLAFWAQTEMEFVEQGARLHHRAVNIHPFLNGNGRWSRLLSNIWLWRNGQPPTEWPEAVIGDSSILRGNYLEAVIAADSGDYAPLIALHRQHTV